MTSNRRNRIGVLLVTATMPWSAMAGGPAVSNAAASSTSDRASDASIRAGAAAWFREYIQPTLEVSPSRLETSSREPILYDPLESRIPSTSPTARSQPPERSCRRRAEVGSLGTVILASDAPQPRGEWDDSLQPEMFRLYFEPAPPAPKPRS